MKKLFYFVIGVFCSFGLAACDNNNQKEEFYEQTESISEIPVESETETDTFFETTENSDDNSQTEENYEEKTTKEKSAENKNVDINSAALSNEKIGWYFGANDTHDTPTPPTGVDYLDKYDAFYVGDTSQKTIYLTFDEGYENGYSSKILDVLKEKNVHAAFFVTKSYIESNQELIKRMVDEGHVVGNHSVRHLSSPDLSDSEIIKELEDTAAYFKEVTGKEMPKVFRPPMGEFSERTLAVTKNMGYKTIFWSFAHKDWLVDEQPGKQAAYDKIMQRYHNGEIALLHAVSQSNTEALGDVINSLRELGYEFGSLNDL